MACCALYPYKNDTAMVESEVYSGEYVVQRIHQQTVECRQKIFVCYNNGVENTPGELSTVELFLFAKITVINNNNNNKAFPG